MTTTLESAAAFAKSFPNSEVETFLDSGGCVNQDILELCAGLSFLTYDTTQLSEFEDSLKETDLCREKFPDLSVRFYQKGRTTPGSDSHFSRNPPTFIGIITGSTLILCWRGSVTAGDFLSDVSLDSTAPFEDKKLEVQEEFYNIIKNDHESNFEFTENYVKGDYSQVKGRQAKDGVPIKRIIFTGHSLGAGIASVAHLCLKIPSNDWKGLVQTCDDKKVCVQTVAFSAPMSTIIDNESNELKTFIQKEIYPNMINIFYSADVVPRAYSDLEYVQEFVDDINTGNEKITGNKTLDKMARGILDFAHEKLWVDNTEQARKYSHIGKILIISSNIATTSIYDLYDDIHGSKKSFRNIKYSDYSVPASKTIANEMDHHLFVGSMYK